MLGCFLFYLDGIEVKRPSKVGRSGSRDDLLREELFVLNARAFFCLFVLFCWNDFLHTKTSQAYDLCSLLKILLNV